MAQGLTDGSAGDGSSAAGGDGGSTHPDSASAAAAAATPGDTGGRGLRWLATLTVLGPCALVVWAGTVSMPRSSEDAAGATVLEVCERPGDVFAASWWTAAALFVALLVWSWLRRVRVRPYWIAVVLAGMAAVSVGGFLHSFSGSFGAGLGSDAVTAADGTTYRAVWSWDCNVDLALEMERAGAWTRVRLLASASTDPTRPARVITPEDRAQSALRIGPAGRVFVVIHRDAVPGSPGGPICVLEYDPAPPESPEPPREAADAGGATWTADPAKISPFALLGPTTRGNEEDVAALSAAVRVAREALEAGQRPEPWVGPPAERFLLEGLDHPNAWVRATARRLLDEGGPTLYPRGSERR